VKRKGEEKEREIGRHGESEMGDSGMRRHGDEEKKSDKEMR
jgi:hypothetical protein